MPASENYIDRLIYQPQRHIRRSRRQSGHMERLKQAFLDELSRSLKIRTVFRDADHTHLIRSNWYGPQITPQPQVSSWQLIIEPVRGTSISIMSISEMRGPQRVAIYRALMAFVKQEFEREKRENPDCQ